MKVNKELSKDINILRQLIKTCPTHACMKSKLETKYGDDMMKMQENCIVKLARLQVLELLFGTYYRTCAHVL